MTGGVIKFNEQEITGWYDDWRNNGLVSEGPPTQFYILRKHIESFMKFYEESTKVATNEKYGPVKFYHIVVGDKRLENGAWVYESDETGEWKDWVGFRSSRVGDPGNPHVDTFNKPEGDGVSVEEDWFG